MTRVSRRDVSFSGTGHSSHRFFLFSGKKRGFSPLPPHLFAAAIGWFSFLVPPLIPADAFPAFSFSRASPSRDTRFSVSPHSAL